MSKPLVLILGKDDIKNIIELAGFETINNLEYKPANCAIILDLRELSLADINKFVNDLKKLKSQRHLQLYGWVDIGEDLTKFEGIKFDAILDSSTPISYIKSRIESANRIAAMGREALLRFTTLGKFGYSPKTSIEIEHTPPKILIFGNPGPDTIRFMSILDKYNVHSVGAFSSFTAFDYLHASNFDAIVTFGDGDNEGMLSFCKALRRNSRLFHMPCLLMVDSSFKDFDEAIIRGASDIGVIGGDEENTFVRLLTIIDEKRRREALRMAFHLAKTDKAIDKITGLYNTDFFKEHLSALVDNANKFNDKVSVAIIELSAKMQSDNSELEDDAINRRILHQAGAMISRLVRTEDTATKITTNKYAIILPFADEIAAYKAAQRICSVIESSAYESGTINKTAVIETKFEIKEIHGSQNIGDFIYKYAS